jgi:hypothetical protein
MRKILAITTALAVSVTILSTIPAIAESNKTQRSKITKIQSVKPGTLTINIKKVKKCSGYEVKVSLNKKFKKSKIFKIKNKQKTIKGLKQGKKYFVKARSYRKINGKKVYGKWSKVKSMITKVNEIDKIRREHVKNLTGIKFSEDVQFLEFTRDKFIIEQYDNATDYYILAKIKIKKKELKKIIKDNEFRKKSISNLDAEQQDIYNCDWWDLKKSQVKDYYRLLCSKQITENIVIKTVVREIIVTKEVDKNGYITVYLSFS